ncbi:hypothetical protein Pyn_09792 [Prunus yedoensis var. nudiflora]|uniref:Uncharacterized protein n=1 Tax=Prunus yedoensis var. nudiflora TaxID=2094558 RepID=A0A314XWP8_PRUYE|nr:hypothetical protein Pyn_09792 [Prunus yedoensis var. nudiflora]
MNNDLPSTNPEDSMSNFDLSKNESYLISAIGGMISIFDMTTFKKVMPPPPAATCLAFHPRDDSIVAIGMDNSTIVIYNLHSDEVTRKLEDHVKRVTSFAFLNTLNVLVSSGADPYWKLQYYFQTWLYSNVTSVI